MVLAPSTLINNRYELTSLIAEGGMGEVWKAVDRRLSRTVAIKTVRSRYLRSEPKALSIFHDEARAGAHLMGHSNVVGILDIIEQPDGKEVSCFIVMEYIDGVSLSQWLSDIAPRLDPKIAYYLNLHIAWQFCRAIQAAHKSGVLHRDIKPLNAILSSRGALKVTDFGLARFIDAVTRTHTVAGAKTAAYAAPEQWRDEKHTENTDIYQLGCALYQLFTGVLPFNKSSLPALMTAHLTGEPPPLISRNTLIPPGLNSAILAMMEKDPDSRGNIWKTNDELCTEMVQRHSLSISFKGMPKDSIELIRKITDIVPDDDDPSSSLTISFPDTHEVLEEGIALALAGIPFSLQRDEVVAAPKAEAPKGIALRPPGPKTNTPKPPKHPGAMPLLPKT